MGELWSNVKPIVEAGVLGALLLLTIRLWLKSNREFRDSMEQRVLSEKEHSKELMKLQTGHAVEMMTVLKQYDMTLSTVNTTLEKLVPGED